MIFKDKFIKNNVLMFFSTSIVSLANLFYQVLVVRNLSVTGYGIFNSLLSTFVIFSLPLMSLSTMIAKFVSHYNNIGQRKTADFLLSRLLRHMFFIALSFLAAYLIFGPALKGYLHLDSIVPVYFLGGMLFTTILLTVTLGGLQGFERFVWFSASSMVSGILKLVLAFLFIRIGWDLLGALGAYLVAVTGGLLVTFYPLRKVFSLNEKTMDIDLKAKYKFVIPSLITFACIALLTNVDVILVRHFFPSLEAGYYSVAQLIGKIVLYIPSAIYIVILPRASGLNAQQKDSQAVLARGLKYAAFLCLFVLVVYNIFPKFILGFLTGKVNDQIVFLGRLFTMIMPFFALLVILLLYQLSVSKFMFLKSLVLFSLLQILAISLFHISLTQVLLTLLINSIILFSLNLKSAFKY